MFAGSARGATELRYVAGLLYKAAAKDMGRELARARREAAAPLRQEVALSALSLLPGRYGPVMANAVRVTSLAATGASLLRLRVHARGRRQHRDVAAINRGFLRHPLFGNRRYWFSTSVAPGFVDRPVDRLAERMAGEVLDAADRIADQIVRG